MELTDSCRLQPHFTPADPFRYRYQRLRLGIETLSERQRRDTKEKRDLGCAGWMREFFLRHGLMLRKVNGIGR
jgi:hypothetical protein